MFAASYTSTGLSVSSTTNATAFTITMAAGCTGTLPASPALTFAPATTVGVAVGHESRYP